MELELKSGGRIQLPDWVTPGIPVVVTVVTISGKYTHTWSHFQMETAELKRLTEMLAELIAKLEGEATR
jgi:hypothetical protein